jgi:EPS-associated MarR family transcriptional regulator
MLSDEVRYRLLKLLDANPRLSQRDVARELGISLGKVNYCLRALVSRGSIKASRFTNSRNKTAYMYLLTPRGFKFLRIKLHEYETLRDEIEQIRRDAGALRSTHSP